MVTERVDQVCTKCKQVFSKSIRSKHTRCQRCSYSTRDEKDTQLIQVAVWKEMHHDKVLEQRARWRAGRRVRMINELAAMLIDDP